MTGYFILVLTTAIANANVFVTADAGFGYNYFSRTNGANVHLPTRARLAQAAGWSLAERDDTTAGVCREGLGIEYTEGDSKTHSKNRPLSLFFDASEGRLSAISVRAWFTDELFYNKDSWQLPTFGVLSGKDEKEGPLEFERWVTVTTRDPTTICDVPSSSTTDIAGAVSTLSERTMLGDRLLVNYLNSNITSVVQIPSTVPPVDGPVWVSGACQLNMSRHWSLPLDGNPMQLYGFDHGRNVLPIVPMYSAPREENTPMQGGITALAFFTTEAQITNKEGGIFDATGTPAQLCSGNFCLEDENKCEYGEGNSVLHIFFADPASPVSQCSSGNTAAAGSPGCASIIPYDPM